MSSLIEDLEDAQSYLKINRDKLDECVIQQPVLYFEVSHKLNEAKQEYDSAKLELSFTEGELLTGIRKREARKGNKITDKGVREILVDEEKFKEANNKLLEARHEVYEWEGMKESFSQRSFMLKELVKLWEASYYETGSIGDSSSRIVRKKNKTKRRRLVV